MKIHSAAANGLATGAFQKCDWGQIDPMVDKVLSKVLNSILWRAFFQMSHLHHQLGELLLQLSTAFFLKIT